MADAFKNLINPTIIAFAAEHLQRAAASFDAQAFVRSATAGLDSLEFKARAMHVCDALQMYLPQDFEAAAQIIERSLAPATGFDAKGEPTGLGSAHAEGVSGWMVWSLGEYVVRAGMQQPERALACLHALTQRFSAEFAIRPFLITYPQLSYSYLHRWLSDPSPHVRRLVSEGSRPRLPWGLRLQALVINPEPSWTLLRALQDDTSAYVRRSVANHLNDIAKDHPNAVAAYLHTQLQNAPKNRVALLRHASRSLIKKGHAATLAAWDLQSGLKGLANLSLHKARVVVGGQITFEIELHSHSDASQALIVDYAVHFVMASGKRSAKVFKGWKRDLTANERCVMQKSHSFKVITTRKYYAGMHALELLVNGESRGMCEFELTFK